MHNRITEWTSLFVNASNYRLLVKRGWGGVLLIFLVAHLLTSLLVTYQVLGHWWPKFSAESKDFVERLAGQIPGELVFSWDNSSQRLEMSEAELPISIATNELFSETPTTLPRNTLSLTDQNIDEAALTDHFSTSQFVLGPNAMATKTQAGSWSTLDFSELPDFGGDANISANQLSQMAKPTIDWIGQRLWQNWWLIVILTIPGLMIFSIFRLIIDGLLVILLIRINRYRLTFVESLRLVMLIGAISLIVSQVALALHPNSGWPFFNLSFWLIAIYVLVVNRRLWI